MMATRKKISLRESLKFFSLAYVLEEPVKRGGGLHILLVLFAANVEYSGVIEEKFAPFAGEAFSMWIDA